MHPITIIIWLTGTTVTVLLILNIALPLWNDKYPFGWMFKKIMLYFAQLTNDTDSKNNDKNDKNNGVN